MMLQKFSSISSLKRLIFVSIFAIFCFNLSAKAGQVESCLDQLLAHSTPHPKPGDPYYGEIQACNDCDLDPTHWIYSTYSTTINYGSCNITYWLGFVYNPTCCQYYVCSISITTDDYSCPQFQVGSRGFNTAILELVRNGPLAHLPHPCEAQYTINAKCWNLQRPNPTSLSIVGEPCYGSTCCKREFVNGVFSNSWVEDDADCVSPCQNMCSSFDVYKKAETNDNANSKDYTLILNTNNSNSYLEFSLNYEFKGKCNIIITDVKGNIIAERNILNFNNKNLVVEFNEPMLNGVYLYKVVLENGTIYSGKFINNK